MGTIVVCIYVAQFQYKMYNGQISLIGIVVSLNMNGFVCVFVLRHSRFCSPSDYSAVSAGSRIWLKIEGKHKKQEPTQMISLII